MDRVELNCDKGAVQRCQCSLKNIFLLMVFCLFAKSSIIKTSNKEICIYIYIMIFKLNIYISFSPILQISTPIAARIPLPKKNKKYTPRSFKLRAVMLNSRM